MGSCLQFTWGARGAGFLHAMPRYGVAVCRSMHHSQETTAAVCLKRGANVGRDIRWPIGKNVERVLVQ